MVSCLEKSAFVLDVVAMLARLCQMGIEVGQILSFSDVCISYIYTYYVSIVSALLLALYTTPLLNSTLFDK